MGRNAFAKQGCWTCKRRKIGCDRALPLCNNCVRTKRECLGYDIRLQWPDRHDGRRREGEALVYCPPENPAESSHLYGRAFLNFSHHDLALSKDKKSSPGCSPKNIVATLPRAHPPTRSLNLHSPILNQDATFFTYYEQVISTMVSTLQIQNGFRRELMPMVLSSGGSAAAALRDAMLAVSSFHQGGTQAALPYKASALRHLYDSMGYNQSGRGEPISEIQVAASMMLCVYSVFDETEGNWHLHLDGAKNMLRRLDVEGSHSLQSSFVLTWFLYHEVFGCFTQPFRRLSEEFDPLELLDGLDHDPCLIVGSLGCSVELLVIIHRINRLRAESLLGFGSPKHPHAVSLQPMAHRLELQKMLRNLHQAIGLEEQFMDNPSGQVRILATAELYRIAAFLYLQRVCPRPGDEEERHMFLEQAFDIIARLEVVTSPWPMFLIACECNNDEQRIKVIRALDLMNQVRKIGNIHVMWDMVEQLWKQHDLSADTDPDRRPGWWEMIDSPNPMPWFI
ncbi:fungal-specific transcription factor domain-containing protein [Stachybotrys elegans]|uniref:Fungal-specific transcription factor domain-containing protein n=1 Tax=Stachybotrys elegans TaxID=80388 RepID=A0A8K0WT04_9HYPO|nr:fungal-specific transcription factor domain-containing protein [Stachybotrys elegans]